MRARPAANKVETSLRGGAASGPKVILGAEGHSEVLSFRISGCYLDL